MAIGCAAQRHPAEERVLHESAREPDHHKSGAQESSIIKSIQCPICDYGVSYVVRNAVERELLCRLFTPHDLAVNTSLAEMYCEVSPRRSGLEPDDGQLHVTSDFTLEALLDLCRADIVYAFPAIETLYAPDSATKRREVFSMRRAQQPVASRFSPMIMQACRNAFSRRLLTATSNYFGDLVKSIEVDLTDRNKRSTLQELLGNRASHLSYTEYVSLLTRRERTNVYAAIRSAQERACSVVCGPIVRPRSLAAPKAAGFDMFGNRMFFHDHLSFEEAEEMRAGSGDEDDDDTADQET